MPIRQATAADLSRIAEMYVFNNRLHYLPIFGDEAYSFGQLQVVSLIDRYFGRAEHLPHLYVYEENGLVKGFAELCGQEIVKLYTDPFFQSRGVGGALIEYAVSVHGARVVWALEKNTRALSFYRRHGFAPSGQKQLEEGTSEYLVELVR